MTIDQLIIKELDDLDRMAKLDGLENPRFSIERGDDGAAILLTEVDGTRTVWYEPVWCGPPDDIPIYPETSAAPWAFLNITLICPQYVTIFLNDGTVKRGRDMTPEARERWRESLAEFYLKRKGSPDVERLQRIFPVPQQ